MSSSTSGCLTLPSGVLERLPFLKDQKCVFFDFGLMYDQPLNAAQQTKGGDPSAGAKDPIVTVITDRSLVVATFPRATRAPRVVDHERVVGVSRDEDRVIIHLNGEADIGLILAKADTFVVYLVDLQDRTIGRSLHFANKVAGAGNNSSSSVAVHPQQSLPRGATHPQEAKGGRQDGGALTAAALRAAEEALCLDDEISLGAIRFGRASKRESQPTREVDEGSDASSVATIYHEVEDEECLAPLDFPLVSIDARSLRTRLFYFFQHHDRAKLPHIDEMIRFHRGRETQFLHELERQYGPEPNKSRWETRDQLSHQRRLNDQLKAQLKRAKDELLLLSREEALIRRSKQNVAELKEHFVQKLREEFLVTKKEKSSSCAAAEAAPMRSAHDAMLHDSGLVLIRVLSVASPAATSIDMSHRPSSLLSQESPMGNEAFFVAPQLFFDFVKEQAGRVHGATLPPLCCVRNEGITPPSDFSDNHLHSGARAATAGATTRGNSFLCNWSFLAGWVTDIGPHTVAMVERQHSKSGDATQAVKFIKSKQYWK